MIVFQRVTEDSAVLASGRAVLIYGLSVGSGGSASTVHLRNGTSASAAIGLSATGTAGNQRTFSFSDVGVLFPSGCFIDVDANVTYVTVFYEAL